MCERMGIWVGRVVGCPRIGSRALIQRIVSGVPIADLGRAVGCVRVGAIGRIVRRKRPAAHSCRSVERTRFPEAARPKLLVVIDVVCEHSAVVVGNRVVD